jgi:very-short-patch-repair endonuclease
LLAERLARDGELGGLFTFNTWVGDGRHRFLVDLLWAEGKLVVEVDGYRWHSTESMFRSDRYRDYRLMTWGHLVLRLPHDEVMADVALQIEKIRDLVRLIRTRDRV